MKKNFTLHAAGKADARVVDSVKYEVRKYVKRERKKPVPPEFDMWDFSCRVGADQTSAGSMKLGEVSAAIDAVTSSGADSVYIEILAVPTRRIAAGFPAQLSNPSASDTA